MISILQQFLPIISNNYPDISPDAIKFFDDGHDHYVFLLPNGIAFRFPRGQTFGAKDKVENAFLPDFSKQSPIRIQVFTPHKDEKTGITYQTYSFIQGEKFLVNTAKSFLKEEKLSIAKKLGSFLKVLHKYPIEKARSISMDEIDPADYYEYFKDILKENRKTVYPHLTVSEQAWIEKLHENFLATKEKLFTTVVTHFDMLPEHIIVKKSHKLTGVIDFSLRIADPARDFMLFHCYGYDFLETAYTAYGSVDQNFDIRRQFHGGNFKIMYLHDAIVKEKPNEIEKRRHELSTYISDYPVK